MIWRLTYERESMHAGRTIDTRDYATFEDAVASTGYDRSVFSRLPGGAYCADTSHGPYRAYVRIMPISNLS